MSSFAFLPSRVSFFHQTESATTTPGRARSLTRARSSSDPRSLNTRTKRAVDDTPRAPASSGMNIEPRLAFHGPQARHVDEARIQEMPRRRRDHGQRKSPCQIAARVLERRDVIRQRIEPERSRGVGVELDFARRRGERRHPRSAPRRAGRRSASSRPCIPRRNPNPQPRRTARSRASDSSKQGSVNPMARASKRNISVLGFASPSGRMAGLFATM